MTPFPLRRDTSAGRPGAATPRALLWTAAALVTAVVAAAVFWPRPSTPPEGESDALALRRQVAVSQEAGDLPGAVRAVRRWSTQRPDDLEAHLRLIDLSVRADRLPDAIEGAQGALRLKPDHHELRYQLAVWLVQVGRLDEAAAEARRCRSANPRDPALMLLQADVCLRRGDDAQAERLVEAVLRDQPRLALALVLRGALHLNAGKPKEAIAPLRAALELGGTNPVRVRHYLSQALARTGQEEEAKKLLAEVRHRQTLETWEKYGRPDTAAYKVALAESLLATGQSTEAVRLLEEAVAKAPDCAAAHRLLARHYEAQGQAAKAAEHRRKAGE